MRHFFSAYSLGTTTATSVPARITGEIMIRFMVFLFR